MGERDRVKVCMFVMNNCAHDARVLKEARTLAQAGYKVKIIALLDATTEPHEVRDGFEIIRVVKNPLHYRILRSVRRGKALARRFRIHVYKEIQWWVWWWKKLLFHLMLALGRLSPINLTKLKRRGLKGSHRLSPATKSLATLATVLLSPVSLAGKALSCVVRSLQWLLCVLRKNICKPLKSFLMLFHRPLSFLDYYIRAYRIVRISPSDIYHAHDLNTLPVAWWAKRRLGGKLVYDSHELYPETSTLGRFERCFARIVERLLINSCDSVITVNGSIADELVRRYRSRSPVVIKNCPDMKPVSEPTELIRQKLGIEPKEAIILYQGGFSPNRGLENLLLALHYLPEGSLVFMGWGKLEDQLRSQAEEKGWLNKKVFLIPPVPQKELLAWTASADVGVIPYRAVGLNNYYTLPNKLFEYIAAGIPVAASNFPELRKIVLGHQLGAVFNPEDPKDIARAIKYILSDPERYQRMKENARKAARIYNWENESKKLLALYAELTEEKK